MIENIGIMMITVDLERYYNKKNIVEERDCLIILGLEKDELQIEYIDEIILKIIIKPENEM